MRTGAVVTALSSRDGAVVTALMLAGIVTVLDRLNRRGQFSSRKPSFNATW
jgi:hypothetical protein